MNDFKEQIQEKALITLGRKLNERELELFFINDDLVTGDIDAILHLISAM